MVAVKLSGPEEEGGASTDLEAEIFMTEAAERPALFVAIRVDG